MKVMHAFFALLWLVTNSAVAARSDTHGVREKILDEDDNNPIVTRILEDFGSLGDFVWNDSNRNGIQDAGEPGIANVLVTLWTAGPDGIFGTSDDVTLLSATTAANGLYQFTGFMPGSYQIKFTPPAGYIFSANAVGLDNGRDSDADPSTGKTPTITVQPGETDLTWDAGMYAVPQPTPQPTPEPTPQPTPEPCPCGNDWKNHGEYVSCVAKDAEERVMLGYITEEQKDAIVAEAAKSDCGKKNGSRN